MQPILNTSESPQKNIAITSLLFITLLLLYLFFLAKPLFFVNENKITAITILFSSVAITALYFTVLLIPMKKKFLYGLIALINLVVVNGFCFLLYFMATKDICPTSSFITPDWHLAAAYGAVLLIMIYAFIVTWWGIGGIGSYLTTFFSYLIYQNNPIYALNSCIEPKTLKEFLDESKQSDTSYNRKLFLNTIAFNLSFFSFIAIIIFSSIIFPTYAEKKLDIKNNPNRCSVRENLKKNI